VLSRIEESLISVIFLLLVIGTSIWVGIDAGNLGVKRGRLGGGGLDMSVAAWVVCCLLLWIIAFPCYLVARGRYQALRAGSGVGRPDMSQGWGGQNPYLGPQATAYGGPPTSYAQQQAPPPLSADGRWWWDGRLWMPMQSAPSLRQPG
jgi:hypothetical protein